MEKSKYLITEKHLLFCSNAVAVEFATYGRGGEWWICDSYFRVVCTEL